MTQIAAIDGSTLTGGWAALAGTQVTTTNSGTATANRFSFVSNAGPNWTYRAFTAADLAHPVLAGTAANGYVETTESQACYLRLDAVGTANPNDGDDYWMRFRVRVSRTASALLAADDTDNMAYIATGGNQLVWNWALNNSTAPGAPGYGYTGAVAGSVGGSATNLWSTNGVTLSPLMMFGEWYEVTVRFRRAASPNGFAELYINGRKVSTITGSETKTTITWGSQSILLILPSWDGTITAVTDCETWSGTDIVVTPLDCDANRPVTKVLMPAFANADSNTSHGLDWQWNGAGLALHTEYANSTGSERRRIFICSSGTPTATTVNNIGTLPYNEQGWATLVFPDIYVPGGGPIITIKDAANSVNLARIVVGYSGSTVDFYHLDAAGNRYSMADDMTAAVRYTLMLHFNRDGRSTWTIIDRTTSMTPATGRTVWSGPMPDWTPQALGKVAYACTFDTTAFEIGGLVVARRPGIAMVDSMSSASYPTTPAIRIPYTVMSAWPTLEERQCVPGSYWSQRENGLDRYHAVTTCGELGLARRQWSLNALEGFAYTRGCLFICPDGGFGNDYVTSTVTPSTTITTQVNACKKSLTQMFDTLLPGDNAIWITTAMQRNRRASISAIASADAGASCTITATAHGVPSTAYYVRFSGTGIPALDNATTGLAVTAVADANTLKVTATYAAPSLSSAVVIPLASTQDAFRQAVNDHLRYLVCAKQSKGLIAFSDLDADMTNNPSTYPNTIGAGNMWADIIHPRVWGPALTYGVGCWITAKRMVNTKVIPPTTPPLRRLSN